MTVFLLFTISIALMLCVNVLNMFGPPRDTRGKTLSALAAIASGLVVIALAIIFVVFGVMGAQ